MYLYVLYDKATSIQALKDYKKERNRRGIKMVKSERDGEYYSRFTEMGQTEGPSARILLDEGIVP